MADDLHTRLRAAIEERKALAEDLERRNPSAPWRAFGEWVAAFVDQHTCAGGTAESGYLHGPSCGYEPMFRASDDLAAHIAAWDPATVIRHCERDLKVLERHRAQFFAGDDAERFGADPWCGVCRTKGNWPCRELREMAVAYALATEEVNDTVTLAADMARDRAAGLTPEGDTS